MEPNVIDEENQRSLVVKLLNPTIQKSRQISLALPKAWRLTGAVRSMTLAIGIPGDYRDHDVIKEIGSLLGYVSEIENHGPVVVRRVEFESDDEPVEVRFCQTSQSSMPVSKSKLIDVFENQTNFVCVGSESCVYKDLSK